MVRSHALLVVVALSGILLFSSLGTALATPPISPDDVMWSREIASPGDQNLFSIISTTDGGYALAGFENVSGTETGLLLKTDDQGYRSWGRSYKAGQPAELYDLLQTEDGGYILAGFVQSKGTTAGLAPHGLAVKTDPSGAREGITTFTGNDFAVVSSVAIGNSGYFFAGLSPLSSGMKGYVAITDKSLAPRSDTWYGEDNRSVEFYDVKNATGEGFILAGSSGAVGTYGKNLPYVTRIDSQGIEMWNRTLAASGDSYAESVVAGEDGYTIAGTIYNGADNGNYDFYLAKLDLNGSLLWSRSYGGPEEERAKCVIGTPDGGYLLVGLRGHEDGNASAYVVKTDGAGELEWDRSFEDSTRDLRLYSAVVAPDGGYVLAGYASTNNNDDDAWLVKLRGEPGYSTATERPTPATSDGTVCCLPALVLPLALVGTTFAVRRRR